MSAKNVTKLEYEQRIQTVVMWVASGEYDVEVVERIMDVYVVKTAAAYKLLAKAYDRIHEKNLDKIDKYRTEGLESLKYIYKRAMNEDDFSAALKAQQQIHKLLGTNKPELKDITSGGEPLQVIINEASREPKFNLATEIEVAEADSSESS